MNEFKKYKSKKHHRLRKGYGDRLTNYDLEQLTDYLNTVEEKSHLILDDTAYKALKLIKHSHYIQFIINYGWMTDDNVNKLDDETCNEMLNALFKDIPETVEIYWDFY